MLHLVESARPQRPRRPGWTVASTALHGALIATAALAGARDVMEVIPPAPPDRIIFTVVPRPAAPAAPPSPDNPVAASARPRIPMPAVSIPFVSVPLDDIVRTLAGPVRGSPVTSPIGIVPTTTPGPGGVFDRHTVDRAVAPLPGNPSPEFPQALRSAGISGEVLVRFIVDSTGRVEPASVAIVSATHSLFADAIRRWLQRTRYEPARAGTSRVRQLVEQRVEFTLTQ